MAFRLILPLGLGIALAPWPAGAASSRPSSDRSFDCKCLHDREGRKDLCYGYVLTIGPKRLELYEGESGGSGVYRKRRLRSGNLYTAVIKTQTGQRLDVFAVRQQGGRTTVYTDRMKPGDYDFVASCR